MDSRIGLDYIVENKEYTAKLGSGSRRGGAGPVWHSAHRPRLLGGGGQC
jgi:hypothetical protein